MPMADRLQTPPRVTVVIAAWNAETTILRAIDSALAQTVPVEVVVVDDRSTDDTRALAEGRASCDPRLTVLSQAENGGPSAARNRAIAESHAPWIAVLDSDDWMEPGGSPACWTWPNGTAPISWPTTCGNSMTAQRFPNGVRCWAE